MKKITLAIIILFITLSLVAFLESIFVSQNKSTIDQTGINKIDFTKYINNYKINTNKPSNQTAEHLNPPDIDIKKLMFELTQPTTNSFSIDEISKHNLRNDCYLVINNNVYNVSPYINYHPAGAETIATRCGKEVTGIFAKIHSNRAWDLLKKYKIGTIITNKPNTTFQVLTAISDALKKSNPNAEILKIKPKTNFYVAKIIYNNKLYEIHINGSGKIIKEEIEDEESNWTLWETDNDDY